MIHLRLVEIDEPTYAKTIVGPSEAYAQNSVGASAEINANPD